MYQRCWDKLQQRLWQRLRKTVSSLLKQWRRAWKLPINMLQINSHPLCPITPARPLNTSPYNRRTVHSLIMGYKLTINNVKKTYFPHPNIENLSDNFTLTLTMEQTHGDQSVFYGLAFRLSENGSNVNCYTLAINGNGQYELLKYDPNASLKYS